MTGGAVTGAEGGEEVEHGIEDAGCLGRILGGVAQECAERPRRVMMVWNGVTLAAVSLTVMPMRMLKDPVELWPASALEIRQMNRTRLVGTHGACASLLSAPYYTPAQMLAFAR